MERIGSFKEHANNSIPDTLKKCHVLDAWYLAYFYKSYRSTYDPFDSINMVTTPPPESYEWFTGKNHKIIKIWLVRFIIICYMIVIYYAYSWINIVIICTSELWCIISGRGSAIENQIH